MNEKWKRQRKAIIVSLLGTTALGMALSFWKFGLGGSAATLATILCLALGFWITENLVGVLTGVKKANSTAIGLLFLGKLAWWAGLFILAKSYPRGTELPIAIGVGAYLLALMTGILSQLEWPQISNT